VLTSDWDDPERQTEMPVFLGSFGGNIGCDKKQHGRWLGCVLGQTAIHLGSGDRWGHRLESTDRNS
jgi:hypothetical protein